MVRSLALILIALTLFGCAQFVWKADESLYPTRAEQDIAFRDHRYRCLMESPVSLTRSLLIEQPAAENCSSGFHCGAGQQERAEASATRAAEDSPQFKACMESAGFRLVRADETQASTKPKKTNAKPDEQTKSTKVVVTPPDAPVIDSIPVKTAEPAFASLRLVGKPKSSPPAGPAAESVKASDSPYRIQLASLKTRAGAKKEWAKLQATWPAIFGTRDLIIVKKRITGRGLFYRVQTGGFNTRQEARSICAKLREKKQACFAMTWKKK